MTYYDILGVPHNATQEQIKQAYRQQVRFFHPDLFEGSPEVADIKTKQLNEAYGVLGNNELRSKYDRFLISHTQPRSEKPANANNPVHGEENYKKHEQQKKKRKTTSVVSSMKIFVFLALFVCFIVVAENNKPHSVTPVIAESESLPKQIAKPASGTILSGREYSGSEITVTADSSSDYVVSLKTVTDVEIELLCFYVRAGDTVTIGVPDRYLYVYFASGKDWYGYGKGLMFGEDTVYSKDDKAQDFMRYAWEYTLFPVTNGNFSETPISEDEFF